MSKIIQALKAFQEAHALSNRGDISDWEWPERAMRVEGDHSYGYICSKHGLGYSGMCYSCHEERKRYQEEKDRQARWKRNIALDDAAELARKAFEEAGEA